MTPTLFAGVLASWFGVGPPDLSGLGLSAAGERFRQGVELRNDAARARPRLADAARLYDAAWRAGHRSPAVAVNRGRAHFLAGHLPHAIRAFRDGLDLFPADAELQHALTLARAAVAYPVESTPADRVRPDPPAALRNRVSPADLFALAAIGSALLTVGLAHRLTARDAWAVPLAAVGGGGLLLVGGVAWAVDREARRDREQPVVVIAVDAVLRRGNGVSYPPRIDTPLPRGAEVRELARRGGWVQVELPGGAVGWVPEETILAAEG